MGSRRGITPSFEQITNQGLTQTPACKLDKAFHGKIQTILSFRKKFNAISASNRAKANPDRKIFFPD